jgi:uncharacterized membrane protein
MVSIFLVNRIKGKFVINRGLFFTLLGSLAFGFAVTNDKFLIADFSVYAYLTLIFILPSLFMMSFYHSNLKKIPFFIKPNILKVFLPFCLFYSAQAILYFTALKMATNTSQFGGIALTGGILTILMSVIFLKEHKNLSLKIIAAIISFIGLLLIS